MTDKELTRSRFIEWGRLGGKTRAKRLSPERRKEIASLAGKSKRRKKEQE